MTWKKLSDKKNNINTWKNKHINIKNDMNKRIKNIFMKVKIKEMLYFLIRITKEFIKNTNLSKNFKKSISITLSIVFLFFLCSGFYHVSISECGVITRLGKFNKIVPAGLHWRPIFIDQVEYVDIFNIQELVISGLNLTADEKLIYIQTNIQYKIVNPKDYLFTFVHPKQNLYDIIDSSLYSVMSNFNLHQILFNKNIFIKKIKNKILFFIKNYNMGVLILNVEIKKIYIPDSMNNVFQKSILSYKYRNKSIQISNKYNTVIILQSIKK